MRKDEINQARIAENLKCLRRSRDLTQETLAEILEISTSQYSNYEQGTRGIPIGVLCSISSYYNIALDVIVKGDLTRVDLKNLINIGINRLLFPIIIEGDKKIENIEVVPLKASAGYLAGYTDPIFIETLPRMKLPFFDKGTYRAFPITGDSMLPIRHGSIIVGEYIEKLEYIKDGKTYVILTTDGISYKRVIKEENTLLMVSDNKQYKPYRVALENILELWEFKCFISLHEYSENEYSLESLFPIIGGMTTKLDEIQETLKSVL